MLNWRFVVFRTIPAIGGRRFRVGVAPGVIIANNQLPASGYQ
ncbi:MAG TPA: hypothetical protein VK400_17725 [Pyrinomonadaceae bacterium]|nr:hypothetical protein [Pyrinomonadaceae bacterium]